MIYKNRATKILMYTDNSYPYTDIKSVWNLYHQSYPDKYVIVTNGHWWNGSAQFVGNYRVNGHTLSKEYGCALGFEWDNVTFPSMRWSEMNRDNFIGTIPAMQDGQILQQYLDVHTSSVKRATNRTWFGFNKNDECLVEVSTDMYTLDNIAQRMESLGIVDGVVLDSGGSSCLYDGSIYIPSDGRSILSYMIFIFEKEKEEKPVSKKKICIDPGHGGNENYNCSPDKRYYEHVYVLDIGMKLKALLEPYFDIIMTRETDKTVSLTERANIANRADADFFISLHTNAGSSGWSNADGWCVYTYGAGSTLERNIIANELLDETASGGIDIFGNGIFHERFSVLANTNMSAVLIEYGFHTNQRDVDLLLDEAYRQKLAELTATAICKHYAIDVEPTPEPAPTPEPTPSEDAPSVWAEEAWEWATDAGLFDGTMPKENITREQTAIVLQRFEKYISERI